jgi:hypothetical protein
MQDGKIARVEELTRIPSDVQDALITLLSEKTLPVPELNAEVQARAGFNLIATANDRDKGVNELSERPAPPFQYRGDALARHAGRGSCTLYKTGWPRSARRLNCRPSRRRFRKYAAW